MACAPNQLTAKYLAPLMLFASSYGPNHVLINKWSWKIVPATKQYHPQNKTNHKKERKKISDNEIWMEKQQWFLCDWNKNKRNGSKRTNGKRWANWKEWKKPPCLLRDTRHKKRIYCGKTHNYDPFLVFNSNRCE